MENQPIVSPVPTPEPIVPVVPVVEPKTKSSPILPFLLAILLLLSLGSTAFLYYQNMQLKNTTRESITNSQPLPTTSPATLAVAAKSQDLWDINSDEAKSSENIYLILGGRRIAYSDGTKSFFFEVDVQNRSQSLIKLSPNDFSFLDESGKTVGTVVINGGESPFIPDNYSLDVQRQIVGNITFTNIPDDLQKGTLRFQPQVTNAKPIEFPMSFVLPVTGGN